MSAALVVAIVLAIATATHAGNVLAEISVRHDARPGAYHGELFMFPEDVREYSNATFYGYNFRHELPGGVVRALEIDRAHTPGAYLMATDLFANGRLSTMSHTVLMVFPRAAAPGADLYRLHRERSGDLRIRAPDGANLYIDGASGAVKPSADFSLAPLGSPGTPPRLRHRGLHLEIRAVGKSPFLRNTKATFVDAVGRSCTLTTDEIFTYKKGKPESDVFRFESDPPFFGYLRGRCPGLTLPAELPVATLSEPAVEGTDGAAGAGGLFSRRQRTVSVGHADHANGKKAPPLPPARGLIEVLSRLLSKWP
ncbi:MAG: hypothetical protein ACREQQ_05465 [Candidatus Binatia bacterium]